MIFVFRVAAGKSYPVVVYCRVSQVNFADYTTLGGMKMDNILILVGLHEEAKNDKKIHIDGAKPRETIMPARKKPNLTTYAGRFAAKLREIRLKEGLTAQQAAELLNVKLATLYSWERAQTEPPLDMLPVFVRVYNLSSVGELFPKN